MKKRLVIPTVIAIIVLGLFIALTIVSKVYQGGEIPIQIMGALLGAIITAFITMILLLGQSQAEELKERNVRVFEEKTIHYTKFINELWNIWEDRKVTLEELNELMKSITKDIILYTNKSTVNNILTSLNNIAKSAGKDQTNENEKAAIQAEVFNIINQLAKELNLGGEITPEMQAKLNDLETSILPYLNIKTYKPRFLIGINEILQESDSPLNNAHYVSWEDGDYIFIDIENTPVKINIGPVSRADSSLLTIIGFYIDYYQHPKFLKFRDATRGWRKDYLRDIWYNPIEMINFNDVISVNKLIDKYHDLDNQNNPANILGKKIIEFYKEWKLDGKGIDEIVKECS